jgi:hypothetical protein
MAVTFYIMKEMNIIYILIELCTVTIPHWVDEVNSWLINLNDIIKLVMIYYSINDGCDHEETPILPFDYILSFSRK